MLKNVDNFKVYLAPFLEIVHDRIIIRPELKRMTKTSKDWSLFDLHLSSIARGYSKNKQ